MIQQSTVGKGFLEKFDEMKIKIEKEDNDARVEAVTWEST